MTSDDIFGHLWTFDYQFRTFDDPLMTSDNHFWTFETFETFVDISGYSLIF